MATTAFTVEIETVSQPIAGALTDPDGERQEFVGWLGLASALENALRAAEEQTTDLRRNPR
ncbi:MAG: hypothetical protein M3350_11120 [Actinomycetota bacterium]|nr:hypothetical protein [Actinomycetota bacterium]MDQ3721311.1 hypothetical protein [Actinomycetota bacterium]